MNTAMNPITTSDPQPAAGLAGASRKPGHDRRRTARKVSAVMGIAAAVGLPLANDANAATKTTTKKTTTKKAATTTTTKATSTASSAEVTVSGSVVSAGRWGSIQIQITTANKKIVAVSAPVVPESTPHSIEISNQAIPAFHREVLVAQSADIDSISRATDTWQAYVTSLQSAIDTAKAQGLL